MKVDLFFFFGWKKLIFRGSKMYLFFTGLLLKKALQDKYYPAFLKKQKAQGFINLEMGGMNIS